MCFLLHVRNYYPERYRPISLSFLDDPNDWVRDSAVRAIEEWKDAQDILKKYIQDHGAKKYIQDHGDALHHAESIRSAKIYLENLQEDLSRGNGPASVTPSAGAGVTPPSSSTLPK